MIQIKKSKYDNYCTCCRKPFDDSMEVSFSHKDYNDSVNITLCGKCRRELMEALSKAETNCPEIPDSWIPFKTRPLTEEEKEEYPDCDNILDCELPEDGQEILVTIKNRNHEPVQYDEFYTDDGCYLDSGYEIGTEATAWMPLPEPYMEGEANE